MEKEREKLQNKNLVNVWEDIVDIKEMLIALLISTVLTLGGYIIAPDVSPKPLLFGLVGALVGFVINTFLFEPKRILTIKEEEE